MSPHRETWKIYLDLRLDRISVVPVVPNRLSFAVFVRRALAVLEQEREGPLTKEDVVAVALPASMKHPLEAAIAKLPAISLLVSQGNPKEAREVFGVTPGDGIVEAVRWAIERGIPWRLIDREVAPGNLQERDCSPDPAWADDGYALERGAAAYLDLVHDSLVRSPRRLEPLDTWREVYMALELRRLCAQFRRVFFVCQAPHARPISNLLSRGEQWRGLEEEPGPAVRFEVLRPTLPILLRYLDDIPRLVERYEKVRGTGDGVLSFDKRTALLEEVLDWSGGLDAGRPSPRHLRAFCKLLPAQLRSAGRLSPRLADCTALAECCFDRSCRGALRDHLIGYCKQIDAARIRSPGQEAPSGSSTDSESEEPEYEARGCNPSQQILTVFKVSPWIEAPSDGGAWRERPASDPPPSIENPFVWPLYSAHHNEMRRKVYRLARSFQRIELTREYRGALEEGVDVRRVLASYFRGERRLFVRRTLRRHREARLDRPEPIVWVFAEPGMQSSIYNRHVVLRGGEGAHTALLLVHTRKRTVYAEAPKDGGRIVDLCDAIAAVSFYDLSVTLKSAEQALGARLERHIPTDARLAAFSTAPESWLDNVIDFALTFAEERLYCVSLVESALPLPGWRDGKEIVQIPAEKLGRRALEKLAKYCIVEGDGNPRLDDSDELSRRLVARYAEIVGAYWP